MTASTTFVRRSSIVFAALFMLVAGPLAALAQTTLATIRGTVYDAQQSIVPGASVVIDGNESNRATAVLDADTVASPEGFSVGRVVRLGLRLRF